MTPHETPHVRWGVAACDNDEVRAGRDEARRAMSWQTLLTVVPRDAFIPDVAVVGPVLEDAASWIDRRQDPDGWWRAVHSDTAIEIDAALAARATEDLDAAGYTPQVIVGDGARGREPGAPYDRVHITAGVGSVPYAWIAQDTPISGKPRTSPTRLDPRATNLRRVALISSCTRATRRK